MWPDERIRASQRLRVTQASHVLPIASPATMLPGQFVTLALPTQRETLYRSYSPCGAGSPDQPTSTPRPAQPTVTPAPKPTATCGPSKKR